MTTYTRAMEVRGGAACVIISVGPGGQPRARIELGALRKLSAEASVTVGTSLSVPLALGAAEAARAEGIVERVAVVIDNPALWNTAWGDLREAD